jgi:T-complex protein 1 subunit theta
MFNCPLDNLQTETKGTVLLKNADELKNFTKTEEQQLYNAVKAIAESGAKVVVCGGKISDLGLDYANKMGLMTVRYWNSQ